jgi:pSer/pThr/pTyr-binding forkhead associated (FHA) protein
MKADLVLLKKDGTQQAFPLTSEVVVLGRRHDCDLQIPLPTVSRRHCQISSSDGTLRIRDLGSTAGTFLNEKRVNGEGTLNPGDQIRIGPLTFVCRIDGKPETIGSPKKAPAKPAAKPKPESKPAKAEDVDLDALDIDLDAALGEKPSDGLDDSFADLDASDSFIGLDEEDEEDAEDAKSK